MHPSLAGPPFVSSTPQPRPPAREPARCPPPTHRWERADHDELRRVLADALVALAPDLQSGGLAAWYAEALVAEIFPDLRRREFQRWVGQIIKRLGVHIELEQAAIAAIDSEAAP